MKTHIHIALTLAPLALASAAWAATPLPLTNPGFEDPVLGDGNLTNNGVPGWTAFNSGAIAVLNPSESTDLTAGAPEGQNVALVTSTLSEDGLSQVLASTFQADSGYVLTVKVANTRFTAGFPGYRVQLLAGGTILAEDNNSQALIEDAVAASTVNYTYDAGTHAALVGQPLEIRLLSKGLANGQELAFDDVKLTVTLGNPLANPGGPYTVALAGNLLLNGSNSLPSEGQTITTYEWDLNISDNGGAFNPDVTGATPVAIPYATLQSTYGMVVGANPIRLRVTDNSSPTPKTSTVEGTVTLSPPIGCQLGVLNLNANGGINPNTGNPWQLGDKYRLAFHTLGTTVTTSNDPDYYNDFATNEAWTVTALKGTYWRAMVTVNLDPTTTQALSPKSEAKANTGTGDLTGGANQGGAGEPVFVVNGTTCIARNNADIWNAWSNPFENSLGVPNTAGTGSNTTRVTGVFYSPFLDQNGNQTVTPDAVHGKDVATGCDQSGNHVNALGDTTDTPDNINRGNSNANNTSRVWNRFTDTTTTPRSVYAISVPLTIVSLADTVDPTLISFTDDRSGADVILGVGSVVYTVTFSEPIDASTVTIDDFENGGSATATIDKIRGTLNPAAFEVTVTPTSSGTLKLQTKAGAVIEDPVGNAADTTLTIADDTIINVLSDTTAPTLVSIEDNISGGPVVAFNPVTYTVTFNEGVNASTVNIDDFENGGGAPKAPITVTSVSPTANPAVYTVAVTPTGPGNLTLQIAAGATITDLIGNPLVTTSALPDDTTITVTPDPLPTVASIADNQAGGPVFATQSFTYLVTFDQVINPTTVDAGDFENSNAPALTVNAVATTSNPSVFAVHVAPGGPGTITLQIKAGAVITNTNGTALDTTAAIPDDTALTVNAGSGPARGVITVDGTASATSTTATLAVTLDASGSDKLVVIVTGENGNPGSLAGNCTGITYDGVPLTQVVDRSPIGSTPVDQTFNDIWYLDNPTTSTGSIVATVGTRGNITAFALSGTAPGAGQSAISPQASKSVILSTSAANSIVIACHGMGGDGNSANVTVVDAVAPLVETSARAQASGAPSPWDGHVTAYALVPAAGTATYAFTGGNLVGSHTIAAEFLAAEAGTGSPYATWATTNAPTGTPADDYDGDGVSNAVEFVLGGTASTNDLGKLPAMATNNGNMTFTFVRKQNSIAPSMGVSIVVGTDLVNWPDSFNVGADTAGSTAGVVVTKDSPNAGEDTIVLTLPQAPDPRKFARLKVVVSP